MLFILCAVLPSIIVAWIGTGYLRQKGPMWGLVDVPAERKIHASPMPTGGGLAIWLAVIVPFFILQIMLWGVEKGTFSLEVFPGLLQQHFAGLAQQMSRLWTLLAAGSIIMILGLADDLYKLSWQLRLTVQTVVAMFMVWQGWELTLHMNLPQLTALLSVLWIVGLTNSFNMLDNMDGLAAGVAAIAAAILATAMLLVSEPQTHIPQFFVAGFYLVLTGSLLGFLWHNHSPARIFMGGAGSYWIGFCLATTTLSATFSGGILPRHAILVPLCALAIPLYDTVTVIAIRLLEGRSPVVGDRSHFSHRLERLGLSRKHAVWTIYLATMTCGLGALLLHQVDFVGAILVLALVGCVLTIIAILEMANGRRQHDG